MLTRTVCFHIDWFLIDCFIANFFMKSKNRDLQVSVCGSGSTLHYQRSGFIKAFKCTDAFFFFLALMHGQKASHQLYSDERGEKKGPFFFSLQQLLGGKEMERAAHFTYPHVRSVTFK